MNSSTGAPALTMSITRRGRLSRGTISGMRVGPEDPGALGFVGQEVRPPWRWSGCQADDGEPGGRSCSGSRFSAMMADR
jgi:hypothetical protein